MAGAIDWGRLPGETVETIIATYIERNHVHAQRIRPSVGDGGIDVVDDNDDGSVDIYQIKKFSVNLNASQKRQIEASWQKACDYTNSRDIRMKHWYLVMPLDPTKENEEWFKKITNNAEGVICRWIGLLIVDDWASQMPEVADYFIRDRSREVQQKVHDALEAGRELDVANSDDLFKQLTSLQRRLNQIDPYYSYSVSVLSEQDELVLRNKHSLVFTAFVTQSGQGSIVFSCFQRFDAASEFEPIQLRLKIPINSSRDQQAFQFFQQRGYITSGLPAVVDWKGTHLPFFSPKK